MRGGWLGLAFLLLSSLPAGAATRILFVGNSLTYVNNLPAVFAALAESQDHSVETGMLVSGGAALADHLATGAVATQLDGGDYATLVLQERGGMLVCAPFQQAFCEHSRAALEKLVALGHRQAARVFLLGSYQPGLEIAKRLQDNERQFARAAGADAAVQVATAFATHANGGKLAWTASDGMHPGRDLTLLYAVQLYRAQFGAWPDPMGFEVTAPGYLPASHFERSRLARDQTIMPAGRPVGRFTAAEMRRVLAIAREAPAPAAGG